MIGTRLRRCLRTAATVESVGMDERGERLSRVASKGRCWSRRLAAGFAAARILRVLRVLRLLRLLEAPGSAVPLR